MDREGGREGDPPVDGRSLSNYADFKTTFDEIHSNHLY